jgi:membrane associated rhomboid family serine protease
VLRASRRLALIGRHHPALVVLVVLAIVVFPFSVVVGDGGMNAVAAALLIVDPARLAPGADATAGAWQPWRWLTPIFLHFSVVHLAFNCVVVVELGRRIEAACGSLAFLLLVGIIGVVSNVVQLVVGSSILFGGLSGVGYGLLGFLLVMARRAPGDRRWRLPPGLALGLMIFLVIFSTGITEPFGLHVANAAHWGGLIAGAALGLVWRARDRLAMNAARVSREQERAGVSRDGQARVVRLSDYRPPAYRITSTDLTFEIGDGVTQVTSRLRVARDPATPAGTPLVLDGVELELVSVTIDGVPLGGNQYGVDAESLTIHDLPDECELGIVTRICPEANAALEGLYKSGSMYCTQCEAEGFRRMTYYLDRPDVLARFRTTIVADAGRYPVLLSNGNPVAEAWLGDGRRRVTWEDPFPKPSYLFALVAGDLALLEDTFVTMSGRQVALRIYSEPHNIDQCGYAMEALKRAMRWDETAYGREYDLDIFMIVAVDDFNMGAMENKGLNIFNTSACSRHRTPQPTPATSASRRSWPTSTSTTGRAIA